MINRLASIAATAAASCVSVSKAIFYGPETLPFPETWAKFPGKSLQTVKNGQVGQSIGSIDDQFVRLICQDHESTDPYWTYHYYSYFCYIYYIFSHCSNIYLRTAAGIYLHACAFPACPTAEPSRRPEVIHVCCFTCKKIIAIIEALLIVAHHNWNPERVCHAVKGSLDGCCVNSKLKELRFNFNLICVCREWRLL